MSFAERIERKWIVVGSASSMAVIGIILKATVPHAYAQPCDWCGLFDQPHQRDVFGFPDAFCLRDYGVTGVFALIAGAMVIVVVTIGVVGPRTNGLKLEAASG
ncbi:hypothetical protein ACNJX9_36300 [Bradyrhizobium sp. DASA03076]|uniref:hypothetical protein n=1 Tax=Bradyrhizobium sp. BLXBL-03 TaxID=3395916 RepID=UPI003F6E7958